MFSGRHEINYATRKIGSQADSFLYVVFASTVNGTVLLYFLKISNICLLSFIKKITAFNLIML